jgi:O-antigen ligase
MNDILLLLLILLFVVVAVFNAKRLPLFCGIVLILVIPITNMSFMPRAAFGIVGANIGNVVWLAAVFSILPAASSGSGLKFGYYFKPPLLFFFAIYFLSAIYTLFDIGSISSNVNIVTRYSVLLEDLIKPVQIVSIGWLIMLSADRYGGAAALRKYVYLVPLIIAPIQLYYYIIGGGGGEEEYREGRNLISTSLGYHANQIGAVGTYILAILLTSRDKEWAKLRYLAIGAALLIVVISFSRAAYITTLVLAMFVFFTLKSKEKIVMVGMGTLVIALFSAQVLNRINYGVDDDGAGPVNLDAISAGRIDGLWGPLVPHMLDNIVLGSGVHGLLKAGSISMGMPGHPHNAYLEVILDSGLVGFVALIFMLVSMWRAGAKSDRTMRLVLLCWLIMGLTGGSFYPKIFNLFVWISYGLCLARPCSAPEQVMSKPKGLLVR